MANSVPDRGGSHRDLSGATNDVFKDMFASWTKIHGTEEKPKEKEEGK